MLRRILALTLLIAMAVLLSSCPGATSAPISGFSSLGEVSVSVTPSSMVLQTNTVQTFTATVNNSGLQTVQWEVCTLPVSQQNCLVGGNNAIGTIDNSGNYTAPQFVPVPAQVVIMAVPAADNTKDGTANITIEGTLIPAKVTVSLTSADLQVGQQLNLSASVTGPADQTVIWKVNGITNGNREVGTIEPGENDTAVYTAPSVVPSQPTVTIKVVSNAEPDEFAICSVTISLKPPNNATVTINPLSATVQVSQEFMFTASVVGISDTRVKWQVANGDGTNPEDGGNQINGTIFGNGNNGTYTAPATVPKANNGTVIVRAVSIAQPTKSASAVVTITAALPNGVTISINGPANVTVGSEHQYAAAVSNATDTSVVWDVNGIVGGNTTVGTIVQDPLRMDEGDYTAPQQVPTGGTVAVGARPNADPTKHQAETVTIMALPVTVMVVCTPNTCPNGREKVGVGQQQSFEASISGTTDQRANWYVCTGSATDPANCAAGGNSTLGTIIPDTGADFVTYTAPATIPAPSPVVIIKAVPEADAAVFGTFAVTITANAVNVEISPSGSLSDPAGELFVPPFTANVTGSLDQNVSWYVNGILQGDSSVGTMTTDPNAGEDYLAPATIPAPPTVQITAVPEADPSVVSNTVNMTITQPPPQVTITLQQPADILPGGNETVSASLNGTSDPIINWSLSPVGGGICTDPNPPTPCGTITATTSNGQSSYTAPPNPPNDPYQVNITATADADPHPSDTKPVTITQNATASISINPPPPIVTQAGSTNVVTFSATVVNLPPGDSVAWAMGCNSLAPTGENPCGKQFGTYPDKAGPGCINYPGQSFPLCHNGGFDLDPTQTFTYTPPGVLGPNFQKNNCSGQDLTNGWVEIDASITPPNCSQTSCTATVCIEITP